MRLETFPKLRRELSEERSIVLIIIHSTSEPANLDVTPRNGESFGKKSIAKREREREREKEYTQFEKRAEATSCGILRGRIAVKIRRCRTLNGDGG